MGKAYKARAAEGYYDQFLEILSHVYIYTFPRLTKKKKKKKKKKKQERKKYSFRSQYKIKIINHNKL